MAEANLIGKVVRFRQFHAEDQSMLPGIKFCCLVFVVALAPILLAAEPDDSAKELQGTWTPSKAEMAGQPLPEAFLKSISLMLADGKYEALVAGQSDKGTFEIDTSSNPKGMSITGTEGPNKGKTFPAIYEIEGDTLTVCYDLSGEKRPTEFKTRAGTKLYLVTYSRTKD